MKISCEIIKDLIPMVIDDVAGEESKKAVEEHLNECEYCKEYFDKMKGDNGVFETEETPDEAEMVDSLKNVKKKMNSRFKRIIAVCAALVVVLFGGYYVLFNMPIKDVSPSDVGLIVETYRIEDLINKNADGGEVKISAYEDDNSGEVTITVPHFGDITVTEDVLDKSEYITAISYLSNYFLREISYAEGVEDDVIYIDGFKTTILNNEAEEFNNTIRTLEFKKINKIVYVKEDGTERVKWDGELNEMIREMAKP